MTILTYDALAAEYTRQLRVEQAKIDCPIGPYDQMIAGHARGQGLIVVTNNWRESDRVPELRVKDWTQVV